MKLDNLDWILLLVVVAFSVTTYALLQNKISHWYVMLVIMMVSYLVPTFKRMIIKRNENSK